MFHSQHILQVPAAKRRAVMAFTGFLLGLIAALAGCSGSDSDSMHYSFKDPSGEPIKAVVRTTVPLAYAASVAMSSVTGSVPPNAVVSYNTCSTSPADCSAVITITNDNSSVPLQLTTGTITVYGYWSSPDHAILTAVFSGTGGSNLFPVYNVSLFPVSKTGSSLKIVYASLDINVTTAKNPAELTAEERNAAFLKLDRTASSEASANVNMEAWIVDRNDNGSPGLSDDTYSISGGGQYFEAGSGASSFLQLGMANVLMGSDCLLNPNSGFALLNEFASSSSDVVVATALISFHSSCDGNAKVTGAFGNYLLANGASIPLDLSNP